MELRTQIAISQISEDDNGPWLMVLDRPDNEETFSSSSNAALYSNPQPTAVLNISPEAQMVRFSSQNAMNEMERERPTQRNQ